MLTKELLRHRITGGRMLKPLFIDSSDHASMNFAEQFLEIYRSNENKSRAVINEEAAMLANSCKDLKLTRGLVKVLEDKCEFSGNDSISWQSLRQKLFHKASEAIKNGKLGETENFRELVFKNAGCETDMLKENIYGDLPEFERLIKTPEWSKEDFIKQYNKTLAQSYLLHSKSMICAINEPDTAKMRRFFKQIKFFRLLAETKNVKFENSGSAVPHEAKLEIAGPGFILENGAAYGLRLAAFFPAVLALEEWKMEAEVKFEKTYKYVLDSAMLPHERFGHYAAYTPDEIKMFENLFREKSAEWKISEPEFLRNKENPQQFIFPDMTFVCGKQKMHLELFHKWHAGTLQERLDYLEKNPELPLIIGIDRSIFPKRDGSDSKITNHPLYGKKIFLFRNFPGVENMLKLLDTPLL